MPTLDATIALISHYGYFLLFPLAIVEGPIVTVIAGFLVAQGILNVFAVYGVVVVGDLVGDLLYYAPARWGKEYLERWGPRMGLRIEQLRALEERFRSRGGRTLLFGKLTHSAGFLVLMAAGAARMPLVEFLWYNLIGTLPKSFFFLLIGYFGSIAISQVDADLRIISAVIFVALCATAIVYYVLTRRTRQDDQTP